MNQRMRPVVLLSFLIFSTPLIASQALTVTKGRVARSLLGIALSPFLVAAYPVVKAAEIIRNTTKEESAQPLALIKETPKIETPLPPREPLKVAPTQITLNATPMVSIPQVVENVISGIPRDSTRPVFINVNVNTTQTAATAHTDSTQSQEPTKPLPSIQKPSTATPEATASIQFQGATHYLARAQEWMRTHKMKCALSCGTAFYGGLHLYLWNASVTLSRSERWSLWKPICSLADLYQTNQKELLKSFMGSLNDTYNNDNQLTNAQRFLNEASRELGLLKRYKRIIELLDRWYLRRIFFVNRSILSTIPERIQRLDFLKNTVAGWLKEHQQTYSYDKLFTTPAYA